MRQEMPNKVMKKSKNLPIRFEIFFGLAARILMPPYKYLCKGIRSFSAEILLCTGA